MQSNAYACTMLLSVHKGKGEQRLVKVVDAQNLHERHSLNSLPSKLIP